MTAENRCPDCDRLIEVDQAECIVCSAVADVNGAESLSQARKVISELEADPRAREAVRIIKGLFVDLEVSGSDMVRQLKQAIGYQWEKDPSIRQWMRRTAGYARELLSRD